MNDRTSPALVSMNQTAKRCGGHARTLVTRHSCPMGNVTNKSILPALTMISASRGRFARCLSGIQHGGAEWTAVLGTIQCSLRANARTPLANIARSARRRKCTLLIRRQVTLQMSLCLHSAPSRTLSGVWNPIIISMYIHTALLQSITALSQSRPCGSGRGDSLGGVLPRLEALGLCGGTA